MPLGKMPLGLYLISDKKDLFLLCFMSYGLYKPLKAGGSESMSMSLSRDIDIDY